MTAPIAVSGAPDTVAPMVAPRTDYELRRSARRTRTMTVFREAGRLVVVVPARLSQRQVAEHVPALLERYLAKERRRAAPRGDEELTARAAALFATWVAPAVGVPVPELGVRWVSNMRQRWGSCTSATGEIRISDRLKGVPAWVVDHVLLHEVVHLVEPHHGERFRSLLDAHPMTQRAEGFLEGLEHAARVG